MVRSNTSPPGPSPREHLLAAATQFANLPSDTAMAGDRLRTIRVMLFELMSQVDPQPYLVSFRSVNQFATGPLSEWEQKGTAELLDKLKELVRQMAENLP